MSLTGLSGLGGETRSVSPRLELMTEDGQVLTTEDGQILYEVEVKKDTNHGNIKTTRVRKRTVK